MGGGSGRQFFVDAAPLRASPGFRWLFGGMTLSVTARQFTIVAVPYQVYQLTGSTLLVGALGIAQLVPLLLTSVVGGAIVDSVDRRKLLLGTQVVLALTAGGLALNASLDAPMVWLIFVLSGLNAGVSAIDNPSRSASIPALVGDRYLTQAFALIQTLFNVAKTAGPALGGLLIAQAGLSTIFLVEVALFAVSAAVLFRLPRLVPEGGGRRFGAESIREGFSFLRDRRLLQANFLADINAMVFGAPAALFPALGETVLGGDATTVGILFAAPGAGALIAAVTSGWVGSVRRHGRVIIIAIAAWGASIAAVGLSSSLWTMVLFLAIAGGADVASAVFRTTLLQAAVPDELRGRLSAIHVGVVAGGPRLGDFRAGSVAALTSPQVSLVSGGLMCIVGILAIARWLPELPAYRPAHHQQE